MMRSVRRRGRIVSFYGFHPESRRAPDTARLASRRLWISVAGAANSRPILRATVERYGANDAPPQNVMPRTSSSATISIWKRSLRVSRPGTRIRRNNCCGRRSRPSANAPASISATPLQRYGAPARMAAPRSTRPGSGARIAMDEIVFFHRPSRTAIVADLIEAFGDRFLCDHIGTWWQRPLARLDGITAARLRRAARIARVASSKIARPARVARDKALGWRCERVIVAPWRMGAQGWRGFSRPRPRLARAVRGRPPRPPVAPKP